VLLGPVVQDELERSTSCLSAGQLTHCKYCCASWGLKPPMSIFRKPFKTIKIGS
jgi:hypothetical protein